MRKLSFALALGGAVMAVSLGAEAMPASSASPVLVQAATTAMPTVQPVQYYRYPYHHRYHHRYRCYYRHHRRYCH